MKTRSGERSLRDYAGWRFAYLGLQHMQSDHRPIRCFTAIRQKPAYNYELLRP
ncbi:hypothetical protein KCP74_01005 [Salmonella enterica subsp. enterica]|nr:hypothetical protein KCP74_01005 [Salmonella enterica subsp. enterica]